MDLRLSLSCDYRAYQEKEVQRSINNRRTEDQPSILQDLVPLRQLRQYMGKERYLVQYDAGCREEKCEEAEKERETLILSLIFSFPSLFALYMIYFS